MLLAVLVGPRLWLITVPFHLNYNEGWNLYRVALVQGGGQLYGAPPGYWVTNYPPLSFHLAALLDRAVGDLVLVGRGLSVLGLAGTCVLAGACVGRMTGAWRPAVLAGMLVAVWIGLYQGSRIAMNDPQLLATAVLMAGFLAYLRAEGSGRREAAWLVGSAVAVAVALFTKSNLVDLPVAMFLHLLWGRRWRAAAVWVGAGLATAGGLLGVSLVVDGPYFLAHVLIPRDYVVFKGIRMTGGFLAYFAGAIGVAAWWGRAHLAATPRGLLVLALVVSFAVGVALAPGGGLDRNNYFDTLVALAMAVAVALHDAARWRPAWMSAWLAGTAVWLLVLLPGGLKTPERIGNVAAMLRDAPRDAAEFAAGRAVLAASRAPALCENMQLCFAAGQPLDYEPFFVDDQMRMGRLDPGPVLALLAARHWGAVVLDVWPEAPLVRGVARERFSAAVVDAILDHYRPVLTTSSFVILHPRYGR